MNARMIRRGIVINPASVSNAITRLRTAAKDWEAMRSRRLLTRSLSAPPTTPSASIGTSWAKLMRPRSNIVPPSSSTSQPIATVCIQTPRLETNAPMANSPWLRFMRASETNLLTRPRNVLRLRGGTGAHCGCFLSASIGVGEGGSADRRVIIIGRAAVEPRCHKEISATTRRS